MTAREVYEYTLGVLDELEIDSSVSDDTDDSYVGRALLLIDMLQREIARLEGVTPRRVTSFDDVLRISDDSAIRILPYGLAAKFILTDGNNDLYAYCQSMYTSLLKTIYAKEGPIKDEMNVLSGF